VQEFPPSLTHCVLNMVTFKNVVMLCLSICLSQASIVSKWHNGLRSFWHREYPILCHKGIRLSPKIRVLLSATLPQTRLRKLSPWHVDRRKYCQLSSTDDRCHFITLSVTFVCTFLSRFSCCLFFCGFPEVCGEDFAAVIL